MSDPFAMCRALRKAISERDMFLSGALELYDEAYTPLERAEAGELFLRTVTEADRLYEARVREASLEYRSEAR